MSEDSDSLSPSLFPPGMEPGTEPDPKSEQKQEQADEDPPPAAPASSPAAGPGTALDDLLDQAPPEARDLIHQIARRYQIEEDDPLWAYVALGGVVERILERAERVRRADAEAALERVIDGVGHAVREVVATDAGRGLRDAVNDLAGATKSAAGQVQAVRQQAERIAVEAPEIIATAADRAVATTVQGRWRFLSLAATLAGMAVVLGMIGAYEAGRHRPVTTAAAPDGTRYEMVVTGTPKKAPNGQWWAPVRLIDVDRPPPPPQRPAGSGARQPRSSLSRSILESVK